MHISYRCGLENKIKLKKKWGIFFHKESPSSFPRKKLVEMENEIGGWGQRRGHGPFPP